ncbi:hypothetical protein T484DRAFT_1922290 [Baffinella frigidus]|nr:hypothetical protein T484DRAFT_1922290 [Cryptophyta sp. CCMP2293]
MLVQLLLDKGADVESKNRYVRTPHQEVANSDWSLHTNIAAVLKAEATRRAKCVAFAMGHHQRLGAGSRVGWLDPGVLRMVLEQVLPGRTHPTMQMSGASGYILQGIRVDKKGRRPPPIPTPVKAPREPAVKKEAPIEAAAAPTEATPAAAAPADADAGGKAAETETPAVEDAEQKGEKRGHDAEEGGEEPSAMKAKVEE